MAIRQQLLAHLKASENGAVEAAIAGALAHAPPQEQRELAAVLMERNRRPGWIALVRCFDVLPKDLQEHLLANSRNLSGPLSDSLADTSARSNVIDIVRKAADPKLVYLLTETLSDSRPVVRALAARAILEAIRRYQVQRDIAHEQAVQEHEAAATPSPLPAAEIAALEHLPDAGHLRRAVDFALRQYKVHRQNDIVLAALLFERQQDSSLWMLFGDPYDDATRHASQILRQYNDPELAPTVLLALGSPLRAAAIAGLTFCDAEAAVEALARDSYRLLDPLLRGPAAGVTHPRCFVSDPVAPPWNDHTWFNYLRLIDNLGLEVQQKLRWLQRLGEAVPKGPTARPAKLLLLRALGACPGGGAESQSAIIAWTADADPVVARCAARMVLGSRRTHNGSSTPAPVDWKTHANTLLQSPHDAVRKMVSQALSPGQFERLWHEYLSLPPAVQVHSTRALAETDSQFTELLRNRLCSALPIDQARGLKMLTTLPVLKPYREQIIALAGHRDPRIAATAIKLMGRLEDPKLKDLLDAAARHYDPRVRANALESMAQLRVANYSMQVLTLMNSHFNRERANAIRAISVYDFATARQCLVKMLHDPSPHHRVSALWVVSQLNLLEIARLVGSLSRCDPNQHVRKRAAELMSQLQDITVGSPES